MEEDSSEIVYRSDSRFCGDEYRYIRVYNDAHYSLMGVGDNEFRVLRSLCHYTDKVSLCCDIGSSEVKLLVVDFAFRRKPNLSGDGFLRLFRDVMLSLRSKGLVCDTRRAYGSSGSRRKSVMVNPRVMFAGDFHDRRRAISIWDKCYISELKGR